MPSVKFSARAESDLESIIDFTIEHWDAHQAAKYLDGLEELTGDLAKTPALGKSRDELHKGLRVFPYESHLLFYIKARHGITVVRILHESMDAPRHL